MKRLILLCIVLLFTLGAVFPSNNNATYQGYPVVKITANDKELQSEVPAININGTTLVPLRVVAESLSAEVKWNQEQSTVKIINKKSVVPINGDNVGAIKYTQLQSALNKITNLSNQLQLAKDMYDLNQDTSRIHKQEKLDLFNLKKDYMSKKSEVLEFINIVPDAKLFVEIDTYWSDYGTIINDYETAVVHLINYTKMNDNQSLKGYVENLSKVLEKIAILQSKIDDKIISNETNRGVSYENQ